MLIGEFLVKQGVATRDQVDQAIERQQQSGGRIGDNLVALGFLTTEQVDRVLNQPPPSPRTAEETGIATQALLKLMMKTMFVDNVETSSQIGEVMKLPFNIVKSLLDEANQRKMLEILSSTGASAFSDTRYGMTASGRDFANEALGQNVYTGPAPVSFRAFVERIDYQRISNERVTRAQIETAFGDMVVPDKFVDRLGPGINAGRSILIYGPPGNGKTTVAEKVGRIFSSLVYIPYCFEVEGQIVKVFDPSLHEPVTVEEDDGRSRLRRATGYDKRWVPCRRPIVLTGGELSLEMLDLSYNESAKYYEAPMHVKALNGTFIIDDFGRQIVRPEELLNRWIVPLNSRKDFLKLHTGKSFELPFDELVIFSTNMAPKDLMDPAFLRRIPYKLETEEPSRELYSDIFRKVTKAKGLPITEELLDFIIKELLDNKRPLAAYQPVFIADQIHSACKYLGTSPAYSEELILEALSNLYVKDTGGSTGVVR